MQLILVLVPYGIDLQNAHPLAGSVTSLMFTSSRAFLSYFTQFLFWVSFVCWFSSEAAQIFSCVCCYVECNKCSCQHFDNANLAHNSC